MKKLLQIRYNNIEPSLKHCSGSQNAVSQMGAVNAGQKNRRYKNLATELLSSLYIYAIHKCNRNSLLLCFLAFHHLPLYITDTVAFLDGLVVVPLFSTSGTI